VLFRSGPGRSPGTLPAAARPQPEILIPSSPLPSSPLLFAPGVKAPGAVLDRVDEALAAAAAYFARFGMTG